MKFLTIVLTIHDIIGIGLVFILLSIIILYLIYLILQNIYHKLFCKNCFLCKNFYLSDVSGFGGGCWYKCRVTGKETHKLDMNQNQYYKKCNKFNKK